MSNIKYQNKNKKTSRKKTQAIRMIEKVDNLIVLKQVKFQKARWTKLYINFKALV